MADVNGTVDEEAEQQPQMRRRRRSEKRRRKERRRKRLIESLSWILKGLLIGLPLLALFIFAASHI